MRYSSTLFSHTSSPEVDDLHDFSFSPTTLYHSNPFTHHPIDIFDDTISISSFPDKPLDLMSAPSFSFDDAPLVGLDLDSQDLNAVFHGDGTSGLQDSVLSSGPSQGAWPQFGYGNPLQQGYGQQQHQQQQHQQQFALQHVQGHRRALSNASSYGAPDSPYSRASSVQYPTAYPPNQQYLQPQPMWDGGYNSPTTGAQHLPTPSHTPKSDTRMDTKARNSSLPRGDSAHNKTRRSQRAASSNQDAPLTPRTVNGDELDAPSAQAAIVNRAIPKFDRTMSDICQDELYNPNGTTSAPTSAMNPAPYAAGQAFAIPQHNLINQRLNEANMGRAAHLQDARQPSPFRSGSMYAGQVPYTTQPQPHASAALRDQGRAKADALAMQQQPSNLKPEHQPQTVSPKDAFPEQPAPEEENMPSLFPASSSQCDMGAMYAPHNANQMQPFGRPSMPNGHYSFATPSAPAGSQEHQGHRNGNAMPDFPAHLASMETTRSDASDDRTDSPDVKVERPADTSSGAGTYTCTYHGCTERFASPATLQRHKREAHRSTGAGGAAALQGSPDSSAAQMTQAGPHKCTRINPATGKPCNAIFSRPYDLTRHEDTIHAERKKVRCPHCTEEKTFSRADALTRHLRVVHPQVSFPGKHRRRNAA